MFHWTENDKGVEVVEHVGGLGTRSGYENGSDAVAMHQSGSAGHKVCRQLQSTNHHFKYY